MYVKNRRPVRYQPRYAQPHRRNFKIPVVLAMVSVVVAGIFVPHPTPAHQISVTASPTGTLPGPIPGTGPYTVGTLLSQFPPFQDHIDIADFTATSLDPITTTLAPTTTSTQLMPTPTSLMPPTSMAPPYRWLTTTTRPRVIMAPPRTSPPTTENSGYGCAEALAYLRQHANPIYQLACPASSYGHTAVTCYHCYMYPNLVIIAITRPCRIAYMNEAWNSWHLGIFGQPDGPIDPYGEC